MGFFLGIVFLQQKWQAFSARLLLKGERKGGEKSLRRVKHFNVLIADEHGLTWLILKGMLWHL